MPMRSPMDTIILAYGCVADFRREGVYGCSSFIEWKVRVEVMHVLTVECREVCLRKNVNERIDFYFLRKMRTEEDGRRN